MEYLRWCQLHLTTSQQDKQTLLLFSGSIWHLFKLRECAIQQILSVAHSFTKWRTFGLNNDPLLQLRAELYKHTYSQARSISSSLTIRIFMDQLYRDPRTFGAMASRIASLPLSPCCPKARQRLQPSLSSILLLHKALDYQLSIWAMSFIKPITSMCVALVYVKSCLWFTDIRYSRLGDTTTFPTSDMPNLQLETCASAPQFQSVAVAIPA